MRLLSWFRRSKFVSIEDEYAFNRSKEIRENINVDQQEFEFFVDDVFFITSKGVVVTGAVSLGSVNVCDTVFLEKSNGQTKEVIIDGIETFRETKKCALEGENVGMILKNAKRKEVLKGSRLYR